MPDVLIGEGKHNAPGIQVPNYLTGEDAFQAYWRNLMTDSVAIQGHVWTRVNHEIPWLFRDWNVRQEKMLIGGEGQGFSDGDENVLDETESRARSVGTNEIIHRCVLRTPR